LINTHTFFADYYRFELGGVGTNLAWNGAYRKSKGKHEQYTGNAAYNYIADHNL
jgi:hypothetical protein